MSEDTDLSNVRRIIENTKQPVIMQADNPDGDSLGSALALEQIIGDMGKEPYLYCGVDIPSYLRYLSGWDRVNKEFPNKFDTTIIVDTNNFDLFESLQRTQLTAQISTKPCLVIDHHETKTNFPFQPLVYNKIAVATGEIVYDLSQDLAWPLNHTAQDALAASIMSDSLGLTSEATTAHSIRCVAALVESGAQLAQIDDRRRALMKKSPDLLKYKGELLQRVEFFADNQIATVTIPWAEIEQYSPFYNPSILVIDDMRQVEGTALAIAFKTYKDGKITAKIRCNYGKDIAADLAEHFGGGGHPYASGFKILDGRPFADVKAECIDVAKTLLAALPKTKLDKL